MTNKRIKSVSFNVTNPNDINILKHVKRRNFSGYVKNLIFADMQKRHKDTPNGELSTVDKLEAIRNKLNQRKN